MFSKKLVSVLIVVLLSLTFATYAIENESSILDSKLRGCLNLIHNYYDENLISIEQKDELAKIKRIISGAFLSNLSVPEDVKSGSYDLGLEGKIKEILKSGSAVQKEAAVHFICYMMFHYKYEYGKENIDFKLMWNLFAAWKDRSRIFNLCRDLINNPDIEINVCRACYDLFCHYFLRLYIGALDLEMLSGIIEIGIKKEDFFIQACTQILKLRAMQEKGDFREEEFDAFKLDCSFDKDILIKTQDAFLRKYVLKNHMPDLLDTKNMNPFKKEIQNGLFNEYVQKGIERIIKKLKDKFWFDAFINTCNTAIDSNVGIQNIIETLDKVTLESCNYDFNKDLLKVCTRLTKHPAFFNTGLRFMQEYNEMGGLFSYGDEYYHFCNKLICNNLELFCTVDKIRKYIESDSQSYKLGGAFVAGLFLIGVEDNNGAKVIRYIRKNAAANTNKPLGWDFKDFYLHVNPIELIHFQIDEKNKRTLSKSSFISGMLFSKVYLDPSFGYSFLDIALTSWNILSGKGGDDDCKDFTPKWVCEKNEWYIGFGDIDLSDIDLINS